MKGCGSKLVLKQGGKATRKWLIVVSTRNCFTCKLDSIVMQMKKKVKRARIRLCILQALR